MLLVGIVLVAAWLLSLALDIVGAAIHLLLWLGLILIVAGALAASVLGRVPGRLRLLGVDPQRRTRTARPPPGQ